MFISAICCSIHLTLAVLLTTAAFVLAKPTWPLDPTDTCIFTCDYCYKGELLLKCANECLDTEGEMTRIWHKTCPYFGQPIYFNK
ncbi:hypothetical protein C0J52_07747 [Blattella germanica]|nr:hypothetical protein C0J52_07747 [Blattella germanica]